jgi:ATP-dependent RNA helicase DeaD
VLEGRDLLGQAATGTGTTRANKPAALARVLDLEAPEAATVFCRTRDEVDQLTQTMNGRDYRAEALHGGMAQHSATASWPGWAAAAVRLTHESSAAADEQEVTDEAGPGREGRQARGSGAGVGTALHRPGPHGRDPTARHRRRDRDRDRDGDGDGDGGR